MSDQVNSHFAFISLAIIFCCFLSMALIFIPKIVELVRRSGPNSAGAGIGGSSLNGTFQETMTSREEEEQFQRLTLENDELKEKISEKERQIDDVKKQIEQLSREQVKAQQAKTAHLYQKNPAQPGQVGKGRRGFASGARDVRFLILFILF